tara:strand:- start:4760 stop:5278 length:519 start_codon:yes stop_codon:yes gene_type:complete
MAYEDSFKLGTSQEGWMDPSNFDVTNNDDVMEVQKMLNRLGFTDSSGNALAEDSMFGRNTEYAWRSYVNHLRDLQGKEVYNFKERPENAPAESADRGLEYDEDSLVLKAAKKDPSFLKKAAQTIIPGGEAGYWADIGDGRLATKEGKSRLGYGEGQWAPGKMLMKAFKKAKS